MERDAKMVGFRESILKVDDDNEDGKDLGREVSGDGLVVAKCVAVEVGVGEHERIKGGDVVERVDPTKRASLHTLPNEILRMVATHVDPADMPFFAMTCTRFHQLLFSEFSYATYISRQRLVTAKVELYCVLDYLAQSSPDHVACCICCAIHRIESCDVVRQLYGTYQYRNNAPAPLPCANHLFNDWDEDEAGIALTIHNMAAKRFHQGRVAESISLLNAISLCFDPINAASCTLSSYAMLQGHIIQRQEKIILKLTHYAIHHPELRVCKCWRFRIDRERIFSYNYEKQKLLWEVSTKQENSLSISCDKCIRHCQLDLSWDDSFDIVLSITRWRSIVLPDYKESLKVVSSSRWKWQYTHRDTTGYDTLCVREMKEVFEEDGKSPEEASIKYPPVGTFLKSPEFSEALCKNFPRWFEALERKRLENQCRIKNFQELPFEACDGNHEQDDN